jgi:azurin
MNVRLTGLGALALIGLAVALPGAAQAADKLCKLQINATDMMQYDRSELGIAGDCTQVQLTLTHTGQQPVQAMGHNWVLVKAADLGGVASSGMAAGVQSNYIDPTDKRVLAATKLVGGGQTTTVTFSTSILRKGGSYMYLCTFPGHNVMMRGVFKFG